MIRKLLYAIPIGILLISCQDDNETPPQPLDLTARLMAGGETTVHSATSIAFETPAPNMTAKNLALHLAGDAQFEAVFVTAPAEVNQGLGPIFNNKTCIECHPKDGRAAFPTGDINALSGFFLRTSVPGKDPHGGPVPTPGFGLQLQNQAIRNYEPELKFKVTYTDIVETLADGTKITLKKPNYSITDPYTTFPANAMLSPRIGPPVFGLGLLEAIPESVILSRQDIDDSDGDGISGKANYVWDPVAEKMAVGRFGWKANTATVLLQSAGAYKEDMGITNYVFPIEAGVDQSNGNDGLGDDPEIADSILDEVTLYCRTLGVPAPRNIDSPQVQKGAEIFETIGCAQCHVPQQTSGNFPGIPSISNQTFYPYTDMLLHDMGEGLADGRPDFLADGNEWKTRPLWGIGLTQLINGHTDFLHDGRAKNLTEAILWHGGEALKSKDSFKELSTADRESLLAFLNSL
ncbi:di-heme oxidoreductase family protein [Sediminicola luteus]|uniref:Thiol oxidoreductase n=1 Tax=Sediminicola luteus TaxID=319238 RepID=A0A2A4GAK3_9FLAO|nr:di-heme oxidoredictase family protein [Sediminicola luteus]PCE65008.1 thiol oxidoreductase [Sediminicola luteus]